MKAKCQKYKMEPKKLEKEGEWDYDFKYDVLFFKVKDREYSKSIELNNVALDLDNENFLTGIQIFEASKFLEIDKAILRNVTNWKFDAKIEDNRVEIRLAFQIVQRNRLIEKNPIIIQPININEKLPNSIMVCNRRGSDWGGEGFRR